MVQEDDDYYKRECSARKIEENSLNEWENLHSFDFTIQLNMTRKNLQSINETLLLKSIDKASIASIFDLSINKISFIETGTFERFYSVRILIMRVNNLREITSQSFKGLMMLEELYLSENAIFDIERDSFHFMEYLHTIDLSGNCLFTISPFLFYRSLHLLYINLDRNYMNHMPALLMPSFQLVEKLSVKGNRFTNITSLIYYTNIQSLDLSDNPLSWQEISENITDTTMVNNNSNSFSDSYSSSYESDDDDNYERIENHQRRPRPFSNYRTLNRRHANDNRVNFSPHFSQPDGNGVRNERAARMNIDLDYNNSSIESLLMDIFRPTTDRISEEALESLIKMLLWRKSVEKDPKALDRNAIINVITEFYRTKNRTEFLLDLNKIDEKFVAASLKRRIARSNNVWEMSRQELFELIEFRRTQQMKKFTCRNCSLQSIAFLANFTKLKYIDVSSNLIKSLDTKQLVSLKQMQQLIASNNRIEFLNFNSILQHWPYLDTLILNDNPKMSCDLVRKMQNTATYLQKMFKLQVNKCK
ncbi:hypothetical protein PVAND_010997 [Polypedilum vanderplanki]|uniref:Uncharacterized protein n=1 Tax=Polypedilum vanderplanki TaxID=319348 RepID=A0A9J6CH88_POLVA|nr:hypothetical protein PVAND_010997 [Polypedilum vanderplanki]